MRAMQTAVGAFGGGVWHHGDARLPLMSEVDAVDGVSAAHPAVGAAAVPLVACELCREHLGGSLPSSCHRTPSRVFQTPAPCLR